MAPGKISDIFTFSSRFFSKPRFTGSILPSSRFLGKKMAFLANPDSQKITVELGPGTGAITSQILKSGVPQENLHCVEFDSRLCAIIKRRFPKVNVINASAENLREIFAGREAQISAIVSSLPLLSLPKELVEKIIFQIQEVLPSGSRFVQFTYNLNRRPDSIGFSKMRHLACAKVYLNLPPARVDAFEKL
ncbi:MAG: methyltransferase domain-containing protein [Opitutales bacterium]|nr:methyltransferase domain-containing protein [Opitutales bacterium]